MEYARLNTTVGIKKISEDARVGVFEIEGLYTGYGLTLGNALRRTLLSALPGAAVTQIKVAGISHEFSTIPGIMEDMVELSLNFKKLRFRMHADEPLTLTLKVKGEKTVTGADIKLTSDIELINPEEVIAHITSKSTELAIEVRVERGLGYWPVEMRKDEKLQVGVVALDALFSPVRQVEYTIDNMRVGDRTDYNRLKITVETDGTISPSSAIHKSASILKDHFEKLLALEVMEKTEDATSNAKKRSAKDKEE
jgi:DNA-directed RNA polymerase subunit alpha